MNWKGATAVAAVSLIGLVAGSTPAAAAFPGINGLIVFEYEAADGEPDIWSMRPDGSELTQLTNNDLDEDDPSVSADGQWVVFQREAFDGSDDIWKMRIDGSEQTAVTDSAQFNDGGPAFSPDGEWIVFDRADVTVADDGIEVWKIKVDGTEATQLTDNDFDIFNSDAHFSPDGNRIVFESDRNLAEDGFEEDNVWVMNSDGSGETQLTDVDTTAVDPAFTPDGSEILFAMGNAGNGGLDVWKMNSDGSDPALALAANGSDYVAPFPSPDGTGFGIDIESANDQIATALFGDAAPTALTPLSADASDGSWQPEFTPGFTLSADKKQKLGKTIGLTAGCPTEACTPEISGTLTVKTPKKKGKGRGSLAGVAAKNKKKKFELTADAATIASGETATVELALSKKIKRKVKKALKKKGKAKLKAKGLGTDSFGLESDTEKARIKLKK